MSTGVEVGGTVGCTYVEIMTPLAGRFRPSCYSRQYELSLSQLGKLAFDIRANRVCILPERLEEGTAKLYR